MNIKVLGYYGQRNVGDNSYLLAFPTLFPSHNFSFINSARGTDFSDTDLIIVGGGDVLHSQYMAPLYDNPIPKMAMSVTVTNDSDLSNFKMFKTIVVRDRMSLDIAGKHHNNVVHLPDFSFVLTPNRARGRALINERAERAGVKLTSKLLTVVLNSYISFNKKDALSRDVNDFNRIVHHLAEFIDNIQTSAVFIPFSTKMPFDDLSSNAWLAARCKKSPMKNLLVRDDPLSVQDTLDMMAAGDASISTRLHSSIFNTLCGIPYVDLLHHDKNLGFLRSIDKEAWGNWIWWDSYEPKKTEKLITDFLRVGGAGSELNSITLRLKEQLTVGTKNLLR
jgi:polysaccharide pyruvyl transferase WcaK-like protein